MQLISFDYTCHFRFTNDEILFPQTQIASLSYIGVRTSLFYLAPFDVILSVLIFKTPYVFTKFGSMFVTLVSEWAYMVSITQFERSVTEFNVCLLCGFCGDLGLINDAFHITVSIHGTLVRFPTINPSKPEIGVISKHILDEINTSITSSSKINQWKNTSSVLKWFNCLENKNSLSFICFHVCEFYPSITEKLLSKALDFASKYHPIYSHERDIILHAKRSLLFNDNCPWEKKSANNLFDVTMGSFEGAETCELVGCFLLSLLTKRYGQNIGLYRDDGLAAFNETPQEIEKIKKGICKVFRDNDLKITVEANTTKVNFLDVTLDLISGKYYPYTKEGNIPLYVHTKSNHPPTILKNIPESINKRLSEISSDKECFDNAKPIYQEALNKSGYCYNLSFNATLNQSPRPPRNRKRNITLFNPPYSKNVETNVGKCFLSLIDKQFLILW